MIPGSRLHRLAETGIAAQLVLPLALLQDVLLSDQEPVKETGVVALSTVELLGCVETALGGMEWLL